MCGSKGRRMVINSSYHTFILFILSPFFYKIAYLSRFATSYSRSSFMVSMWSYHWWFRFPFASMPLQKWTYNNSCHTSGYCRNYFFGKWNTCLKGGFPHFLSPHSITSGCPYHQRRFLDFDGCYHCWSNLHRYGSSSIDDNNTCNDDGCLGEDMIIHQASTKQWLHSPCYWNV
jgi:hypothetical protein